MELAELIASARRIIAFTGAGISTESGIPDFRGPQGIWTKVDPHEFTLGNYIRNDEHRRRVWQMRVERASVVHEPNDGHRAIVSLEQEGVLDCVITQNIDGLHQLAGSSTVLELHGNPRTVRCLSCSFSGPAEDVFARVRAGEHDPRCTDCGGILKSGTILFDEALPADVVEHAYERARACDLMLALGSSLVVYPAADIPREAVRYGARLAIVNEEPTPLDGVAEVIVRARIGAALPEAVARARTMRAFDASSEHS